MIIEKEGVVIKSASLYSVKNLIGKESEYADSFANGTFIDLFLDLSDYYLYHFPLSGVVNDMRIIPGKSVSGGYTVLFYPLVSTSVLRIVILVFPPIC